MSNPNTVTLAGAFEPLAPTRETHHRFYCNEVRRILKLFDELLGRQATLSDLTVESVARFKEHLVAKSYSRSTVARGVYLLRKVWRQLYAALPANVAKPKTPKWIRAKQPRKPRP